MTNVVLMGAGASYGSLSVDPYPPPLGNGENGLFAKLELAGGIAAKLPDKLKAIFRANFERGMSEYYEYSDGNIMAFQRELASYLAQFKPQTGNVYERLIRSLGTRRVIYASLNYDLLFELSAAAIGLNCRYGTQGAVTEPRLLKPHGSCNFWPDIPLGMITGSTFSRSGRADIEAPVRPLNQEQTLHRCIHEDSLAPAIAMYAEGKAVKVCPNYVDAQQAQWKIVTTSASRIFVVGVRVHIADAHIWGLLAKSKAPVTYFGRAPDKPEFMAWKATAKKKNAFFIEATFAESVKVIKARMG